MENSGNISLSQMRWLLCNYTSLGVSLPRITAGSLLFLDQVLDKPHTSVHVDRFVTLLWVTFVEFYEPVFTDRYLMYKHKVHDIRSFWYINYYNIMPLLWYTIIYFTKMMTIIIKYTGHLAAINKMTTTNSNNI